MVFSIHITLYSCIESIHQYPAEHHLCRALRAVLTLLVALPLQARAMQLALDARKVELRRLQQAAKAAAIAANSAKETYLRAKEEAEADHPLDAEARKRFEQMPDDR
jgi:uncharacterized membrane protein